jgi:hypothetical protein
MSYNGRMHAKLFGRLSATAVITVACAVALAACGSSSNTPSATAVGTR